MRALGAQLLKGQRLPRLVGKSRSPLRVGKQMVQAVAQHHRQHIKDDLTIARGTELLQLPAATLHSDARSTGRSAPDPWSLKQYDQSAFSSYSRSESHRRSGVPHTLSTYAP